MSHIALLENPYYRRRRHHRRNPIRLGSVKTWSQGVDITDAVAAAGGLAAASLLPGYIVKPSTGAAALTTTQKAMKIGVSAIMAVLAGYIGRSIKPELGKPAVIGGFAGTAAMALASFTSYKLTHPMALPVGRFANAIPVSPTPTREGETVSLIQP